MLTKGRKLLAATGAVAVMFTAAPASAGWVAVYEDGEGNQIGYDLRCNDMSVIRIYGDVSGPVAYYGYIDTSEYGC